MRMEDATKNSSVYQTVMEAGRVRARTTRQDLASIPVIHLRSVLDLAWTKKKKR